MRITITSPNPLSQTQESVAEIRKQIKVQKPGSEVEILGYEHLPDVTRCKARIRCGDQISNVCFGSVISVGNPVEREANAELVALSMCCRELGIDIEYGQQSGKHDLVTAAPMERFDRSSVLSCRDISQVLLRMKQYGLETKPVLDYGKAIKKEGNRLTKYAIADFLFPDRHSAVYVAPREVESPKIKAKITRGPGKKTETVGQQETQPEQASSRKAKIPARSGHEAQRIMDRITSMGIAVNDIRAAFPEFSTTLNFCLFASEEQVKQIVK